MKKLLLILICLFVSFEVKSETYVCSFMCFGSDKICTNKLTRMVSKNINGFKNEIGTVFQLSESNQFINLVNSVNNDKDSSVFVRIINKKTLEFIIGTVTLGGFNINGSRTGSCAKVD